MKPNKISHIYTIYIYIYIYYIYIYIYTWSKRVKDIERDKREVYKKR